jgi:hypothetical protein
LHIFDVRDYRSQAETFSICLPPRRFAPPLLFQEGSLSGSPHIQGERCRIQLSLQRHSSFFINGGFDHLADIEDVFAKL